jgi:hypothetical protein
MSAQSAQSLRVILSYTTSKSRMSSPQRIVIISDLFLPEIRRGLSGIIATYVCLRFFLLTYETDPDTATQYCDGLRGPMVGESIQRSSNSTSPC